jgi:uncharacterized protein (DUF2141 family)
MVIVFYVCFISLCFLGADSKEFSVSGTITVSKQGTVYISLLNEEGFRNNYKFLKGSKVSVGPEELKTGKVRYKITGIPKGAFAISAYQDVNSNGKLDSGLFGPEEPWATFRRSRPLFSGPKWEEMVFMVDTNVTDADFKLE